MAEPGLTVIIVTYNSRHEVDDCLSSLYSDLDAPARVIVVDNASTDGTAEHLAERWPHVERIVSAENKGFAAANNIGLARAGGDRVLLLNPDAMLQPGALAALGAALDYDPCVAVAGPTLLNREGTIQPSWRDFPSLVGDWVGMTELYRFAIVRRLLARRLKSLASLDAAQYVDWLSGACLLVRREAVETAGVLDEGFFMFGEEMEWQYRMAGKGWKVRYEPLARAIHLGGASTNAFAGPRVVWQYTSLYRFYTLYRSKWQRVGLRLVTWTATLPKVVALLILSRGSPRRQELLRAFWQVLWLK